MKRIMGEKRMRGRRAMRGKISAIVFAAMLCNGVFANRALAQEIRGPENLRYDRNGIVQVSDEFSNEKVNEKVQRAKELGLDVEVKKEETELLYAKDALEKAKEIEEQNKESIKKLEAAIADQEQKNEEYKKKQEESFARVIGQEWTKEQLDELILGHKKSPDGKDDKELTDKYSSVSVITKQNNRDAEHPFGFEGKAGGNVDLSVGDTWRYKNVFQDSLTGEWIDVGFKVLEMKDTKSDNEKDNVVTNTKAAINNTTMSIQLPHHAKIQLSFFKNGTNELVELEPMLVFTDVDANQGVTPESKDGVKYPYLKGKNLRMEEDLKNEADYEKEKVLYERTLIGKKDLGGGLIFEKNSRDLSPSDRAFWAMFKLPKVSQVTYWFYGGYGRTDGVLHEVGGNAIAYDRPEKEYNKEKIEVSLKEIQIYHKVAYEYVGDVPKGQVPPVDDNKYLLHRELVLANDPATTEDTHDGQKGKWTFKGWYTDKELTSRAEKHPVMQDEILYGAWEFAAEKKPVPEPKPTPPAGEKSVKGQHVPKTGDSSNVLVYSVLLGVSTILALGAVNRKKEN